MHIIQSTARKLLRAMSTTASATDAQQQLVNVFVYGTLKRGQPNHHWLNDTTQDRGAAAQFVGVARTRVALPLVIGTRYNIPFLLDRPGTGHRVRGEVYAVDAAKLRHLDVLEDYPDFYSRRQEDFEVLANEGESNESPTTLLKCWVYLLPDFPAPMLQKPMLESYADSAERPYQICEVELSSRSDLVEKD